MRARALAREPSFDDFGEFVYETVVRARRIQDDDFARAALACALVAHALVGGADQDAQSVPTKRL